MPVPPGALLPRVDVWTDRRELLPPPVQGAAPAVAPYIPLELRGPYQGVLEWAIVADPGLPDSLAWHVWNALLLGLGSSWGDGLLQYGKPLPRWAGYVELPPDAHLSDYTHARAATIYLTTQTPPGFLTEWAAFHSTFDPEGAYAMCPIGVLDAYTWMPWLAPLTVAVSHELAEIITDPLPGIGGWAQPDGSENADVCNWQMWPVTDGPTVYQLSRYASNAAQGCYP